MAVHVLAQDGGFFWSNASVIKSNFWTLEGSLRFWFFLLLPSSISSFLSFPSSFPWFPFSGMIWRFVRDERHWFMVTAKGKFRCLFKRPLVYPLRVYGLTRKSIHENAWGQSSKWTQESRAADMNFLCILIWSKFAS